MAVASDLNDLENMLQDEKQLAARIDEYYHQWQQSHESSAAVEGESSPLSPTCMSEDDVVSPLDEYDVVSPEEPVEEEEEEEEGEEGVKGISEVDYTPEDENGVVMLKNDVVLIQEQTLDQLCYVVVNTRTQERGVVPVRYIRIVKDDDPSPLPPFSSLQRSNVIVRRKPVKRNVNRRGGSLFTNTYPGPHQPRPSSSPSSIASPEHHVPPTINMALEESEQQEECDSPLTKSEATAIPMEYRRVEKFNIVTVSGTDKMGRPVVVFSACRLPPSYQIIHANLLGYLFHTLDKYVESDYVLVYFHYGLTSSNKPSYTWLYQIYKELDRKYKKNLKKLFIVHPTSFVKMLIGFFKPVISYKFGKKMVYVHRLAELDNLLYLDQLDIPDEIKRYDATLKTLPRPNIGTDSRSSFYVSVNESSPVSALNSTKQFKIPLEILKQRTGQDIPLVMRLCIQYISEHAITVLGIFRRTPAQNNVQDVKRRLNAGEEVDLVEYGDPHLAATMLKMFLRELPEPLLTFPTYSKMSNLRNQPESGRIAAISEIICSIPDLNYIITKYLIKFLNLVVEHEDTNKMNSSNLSIVFGPNLLWSPSEASTLNFMSEVNHFTLILIDHYSEIFVK